MGKNGVGKGVEVYRLCVGGCYFEGSVKMAANHIIYGQPSS